MSFERAAAVESDERQIRKSTSPNPSVTLRIAEPPVRDRIQRLVSLACSVLSETESLARDKTFTEASSQLKNLDLAGGIDFYQEVERFEIELIRLALDSTRGCQAKAARLLNIKPTTLNSKIKLFGIQP